MAATPPFTGADAFIQKNCAACHNSSAPAARLDLSKLSYEPANPDNFATWVKVHDRVSAGEMPPAPIPRPPAESLNQFVNNLSAALSTYERTIAAERGRAGLRRLNAYEYENALCDLLHVPWAQIKSKLPQDGEAWRYNKIGAALDVSHVQMARYMSSADYALREAMAAKRAAASGTRGTSPSTATRTIRFRTCSFRCSNVWEPRPVALRLPRGPCRAST